ncbi:MAG: thiamine-phosphate kinase [Candidatus Thorarchaeota archaeon]
MSEKPKTVSDLGERGLIRWFQDLITPFDQALLIGTEDAVGVPFNGDALVVNSDMLVGSTDVLPGMTAGDIAWKAGVMGLSDLAAKGAAPMGIIVSLGFPKDTQANFVAALVGGLNCVSLEHNTYYLGGDTNQCEELVINCTAVGRVPKKQLIRRKGAKPGDIVAITGEFGYTGALFAALLQGYKEPSQTVETIREKALRPYAKFCEGQTLSKEQVISSAIDSSDGLAWSLHELSAASRVGFRIDSLPIPKICREFATKNGLDPVEFVLYGGEEFELIVTIPENLWSKAVQVIEQRGKQLIKIGKATEEPLQVLKFNGEDRIIEPRGYEHFSK